MNIVLVYKILLSVFYQEKPSRPLSSLDKTVASLITLQFLLQNVNFIWSPTLNISYWESYLEFWVILAYPSIDVIAANLNSLFVFLVMVISGLTIIVILLTIHIFLLVYEKTTPIFFIKLVKALIFFICNIYFIPSTTVLVILFKYSTFSLDVIEEYSNSPSSSSVQLGIFGQILSTVFLALILFVSLISECCQYELRHSLTDKDLEAKSFSYIGVYVKLVYFTNCIFLCSVQLDFYFYYLVSMGAVYGAIWYFYLYRLIYYSNFANFLKVTLHFEIFCFFVFFIVGKLANNATIILVLSIFMQPFIIIFSKQTIEYRISKIKPLKSEIESRFDIFELSSRKRLLSPENSGELIKYMNKNHFNTKNDTLFIIQAYYCSDILKNSALGSIKLSRVNLKSLNFFSGFQVYKCYKILEKINIKTSKGFKLCFYLLNIDKILIQEKKLCKNLLRLWDKILDQKCELNNLNKVLSKSVYCMKSIKANYQENLAKHPLSQEMNEMFGTILIEMLGDPELGQVHLQVSRSKIKKKKTEKPKELFSDKDTCIMIISASEETIGKVIYMSLSMCMFLEVSPENSKDYCLNDFVPKPYNEGHNRNLTRYLERGLSEQAFTDIELCLTNTEGFLVDCILNIECIGYDLKPNYIVTAEPIKKWKRETALVSSEGLIYIHSKNFPKSIGQDKLKLENSNLSDFFPVDTLNACESEKFVFSKVYSFEKRSYVDICIQIRRFDIVSKTAHIFYLIHDEMELKNIKRIKEQEEYIEIRKHKKRVTVITNKNLKKITEENCIVWNNEEPRVEIEDFKKEYNENSTAINFLEGNFRDSTEILSPSVDKNSKAISSLPPSSISHLSLVLKQDFSQAKRSLNILKVIGFFSVICN
jgi:hypothetical protein